MIRSMTGFGKSVAAIPGKKITIEMRALNSKQLDLSVKLPAAYRIMDHEIRQRASKVLQRGKIDIFVNVETEAGTGSVVINKQLFTDYYSQLAEIGAEAGIKLTGDFAPGQILQAILRMPDVIVNNGEAIPEAETEAVMNAVDEAFAHLDNFRLNEGKVLIEDMLHRVAKIEKYRDEVTPFEKERTENIKKRIRESIEAVGVPVDTNRLEQEIVFYVEKLDITEEKVRLANHCKYFREVASSEQNAGRKLGFIAQEMGREINTLGSKANDASIQRIVVGMKDELEKIKEQLLNLL